MIYLIKGIKKINWKLKIESQIQYIKTNQNSRLSICICIHGYSLLSPVFISAVVIKEIWKNTETNQIFLIDVVNNTVNVKSKIKGRLQLYRKCLVS